MRFVTYARDAEERVGVLYGEAIHSLPPGTTLLGLLGDDGERLHTAGEQALRDPHEVMALEGAPLLAPIPTPPTVRDFMAFESHYAGAIMMMDPRATIPEQWYRAPAFYFSNPYAIRGPLDDVPIPPGCHQFDFELEVAAVIGRGGRDLSAEEAESHIAGYCLLNDWSARDLQFAEMSVRLGTAKGKDTSISLGPTLVTPDELEPHRSGTSFALQMTAQVNGRVVGTDRWDSMHFSFAQMTEHASRGTEVRPGDVLGSGTCGGGCLAELWGREGLDAHAPLAPGDVVTIAVEELGSITSRVVAYDAPGR